LLDAGEDLADRFRFADVAGTEYESESAVEWSADCILYMTFDTKIGVFIAPCSSWPVSYDSFQRADFS